ncbi:hypothetical protein LAUMK22_00442 [Mycobacterium kansasii]|nr:hypothetical protein LAUMK22_00442 [Mycobacterium kansasii]
MVQEFGWKSTIRLAKVRTVAGMSLIPGTSDKYSSLVVNRPAKPCCQPSIIASENAQAQLVAQLPRVSSRHESRCVTTGPHATTASAITIAAHVPQLA